MIGYHVLVDGQNTAIRTNAVMDVQTKQGERTAAIFGTFNTIHNIVETLNEKLDAFPREVVLLWDRGHSPRRKEIFPEYKVKKREWTPEDKMWIEELFSQIDEIHRNAPWFGVKSFYKKGYEGDDLIYGASQTIHRQFPNDHIVILSTDEDYYQLICPYISVYSPIRRTLYTIRNAQKLIGVDIQDYILYKSLKGDDSDSIPGIKGIGEKTAKALVNKYHTLENMLEHKDEMLAKKTTAKVISEEGLKILDRNNQLMNLKDYVDLTPFQEEMATLISSVPQLDESKIRQFLQRWQFVSILLKFQEWILPFKEMTANFSRDI